LNSQIALRAPRMRDPAQGIAEHANRGPLLI
jgi:hypothetical protein